ncbi:MAG: adenylyl-sulfate kinase [Candidatus Lokiarchaeota archaeon]|nr:adenylyl-sulfate kinase [Candidatus Lokiarchaeota archaeon]
MEHKGFTLWFTGLPCSGKTTLADALAEDLKNIGMKVERLDGDIVRKSLTKDLGFSKEDRRLNIERVTFVAKLLTRNGVAVLCTFVSPYNNIRKNSREEIGEFILVYIKASPEICAERDVKGMWAKAKAGEIENFTGYDDPFEEPDDSDIIIYTEKETVNESKEKILKWLKEKKYIPN